MRRRIAVAAFLFTSLAFTSLSRAAEDGLTPLFNGTDLTGWKMKKGGESLAGKTEAANGRFTMKDGVLVIDPAVKGDLVIETEKSFGGDATVQFQFLPDAKCNNDLFFQGMKFDIKSGVNGMKVGEWNTLVIAVKDGKAEYRCNGEAQAKPPQPRAKGPTPFGIRAEYGAVRIRDLKIKSAK